MRFYRETFLLMLLMSVAMALPGLRSEEISFRNEINGDNLWDFCCFLFLCFLGKKSVKVDFGSAVDCSLTCSSAAS